MKRSIVIILLVSSLITFAQERKIPQIPDIPGYQTLICDFHLHTVFSDGHVWPTIRVDEAWKEGLDAIAITDHLEYLPHKKDIKTDYNRSWQIAKEYAKDKGLIVISGTEITKSMPPGHLNAIFIKDATPIFNNDYKLAIEEAAQQGAFIMWNHPGWKAQQPDTMLWWDEHTELLEKGWIHGIEVANHAEHYPEAINWARDKKLTVLGNSDRHAPFYSSEFSSESHRYCTLVFASEKSEGGIREALFNGRTLAYAEKLLMGREELLKALAIQSLSISDFKGKDHFYSFTNLSDLEFTVILKDKIYADWEKELIIKPQHEVVFNIPAKNEIENIEIGISNMKTGSEDYLKISISELLKK